MNTMRTTVLLAGLTALFLVAGYALGGQQGIMIAIIFALVMNVGSFWFSDKLVLKIYKAKEVGPNDEPVLYQTVQQLAQRARLPMPKVYLVPSDTPNAFATGRNPQHAAVAATQGLMRVLTKEELAGVMAHELAHVRHRDTLIGTVSATIAGAITALASMAKWAMIFGGRRQQQGSPIAAIAVMILAPIAAALIQMAVSRSREYAADKGGAEICGNPLWLAGALRKLEAASQQIPLQAAETHPASAHMFIVNPLRRSQMAHLFSTHPPMQERIRRLEQMAHQRVV